VQTVHYSHNAGCCVRSVAPWITVLSQHTVFTKKVIYYKIYFCVIFYETRHHGQGHVTSGTLCPFFGREKNTDGWVYFAGHCLLCLLLLRPAAVVGPLLPQNSLLTSLAFTPDSEAVSATRISLMVSSSSSIYFFPAIAPDPQSSALFRLLCKTAQFQKHNTSHIWMCLLQWQQNRSKATMWLL